MRDADAVVIADGCGRLDVYGTQGIVTVSKIVFTCECGKSVAVDRKFAGRRGRCPRCDKVVQIPVEGAPTHDAVSPAPSTARSHAIPPIKPKPLHASASEALPTRMRANRLIAGKVCAICQTKIAAGNEVRNCEHCKSSFHATCWEEAEGCGTYGCRNSPAAEAGRESAAQGTSSAPSAPIESLAEATRVTSPSPTGLSVPRSRNTRVVLVLAGLGVLCAVGFVAMRNGGLRTKLAECSSRNGIGVRVYYDSFVSKGDVVFDLREIEGSSIRRIDPVHLLLQFGQLLDKQTTRRLILAHDGRKLMYLRSSDLKELTNEYTHGNPVWSFNHLPERLKTMTGANAYSTWEGGWLGVMKNQSEDLNKFISDWTGY